MPTTQSYSASPHNRKSPIFSYNSRPKPAQRLEQANNHARDRAPEKSSLLSYDKDAEEAWVVVGIRAESHQSAS
jgi:hypothetical protein